MKINNKELLILILGVLSAIAISTITWNAVDVVKEYQNAYRLVTANSIAELTLEAGTELAYERGLTSTLLAEIKSYDSSVLAQLQKQRQKVNALSSNIEKQLIQFTADYSDIDLDSQIHEFNQRHNQLILKRAKIDVALQHQNVHAELRQNWFSEMTTHIARINEMRRALLAPQKPEDFATHYGQLVHESFHSHLEVSGLQRALLGKVIAEQRALTAEELEQLHYQNNLFKVIEEKLDGALQFFPPSLKSARHKNSSLPNSILNIDTCVIR